MPEKSAMLEAGDLPPPAPARAEPETPPLAPLVVGSGARVVLEVRGWEVTALPDRVVVLADDFLHLGGYDPLTGAEQWRIKAQERASGMHTLYPLGERVLLHAGPDLIVVDAKNGAVIGRHPAGGFNGGDDKCHLSLMQGLDHRSRQYLTYAPATSVCATSCECSFVLFRCDTGEQYGTRMHGSISHVYHSLREPHDNVCWTPPRLLGRVKGRTLLALEQDGGRGYVASAVDDAGKTLWRRPELGEAMPRFRPVDGDAASDTCWSLDEVEMTVWTCSTGQIRWRARWPEESAYVRTDARALGDRVLIRRRSTSASTAELRELARGKTLWRRELAPDRVAITPGEDPAELTWDTPVTYAWLDPATGKPLRELAIAKDHALIRDPRGGYLRIGGTDHTEIDRDGRPLKTVPKDIRKASHIGERLLTVSDEQQLVVLRRPELAPVLTTSGNFYPDEATAALGPAALLLIEHRGSEPLRLVLVRAID
ncbi:hypothetical protein [Nannocystis punicea]|uniref:Pyrrolo-quinoline quinone repeat domain-containing protein n=1 Tax=Nannocystis punicea TaxID=2995304 RepID=A0ABY7HID8_9BACT|nr:hypothetical protein [Nannocystis poenicansa]WAS98868.1 hypothetical protein O0S08_22285 [Nannocystis poenicansa]